MNQWSHRRWQPLVAAWLWATLAATTYAQQEKSFVADALKPFWQTSRLKEPVLFIQEVPDKSPTAWLLFDPTKVERLTSATREMSFEEGRDYVVDVSSGVLRLPKESRIPFLTLDELYPLMTSDTPKHRRMNGDMTRGVFFDNGSLYHQLQCEVTYNFKPGQWKGHTEKFSSDALPFTFGKLARGEPIRILLCGDSISAGYNATKFTKSMPGCPAYGELVALGLERHYGSNVDFTNIAVNGWDSAAGLKDAQEKSIGKIMPDLVMIAFGMNDVFARDAAKYKHNIKDLIATVRSDYPNAEFILVAPMLGNKEWGIPMEQFALYRDALRELCGPGIILADLTAIWEEFLKRKSFYDLTGNGLNHPNDFGHCVYAQTVLARLVEYQAEPTQRKNSKSAIQSN